MGDLAFRRGGEMRGCWRQETTPCPRGRRGRLRGDRFSEESELSEESKPTEGCQRPGGKAALKHRTTPKRADAGTAMGWGRTRRLWATTETQPPEDNPHRR